MGNCLYRKDQYSYTKADLQLYLQQLQRKQDDRQKQQQEEIEKANRIRALLEESERQHPLQQRNRPPTANQTQSLEYIEETEHESSYIEIEQKNGEEGKHGNRDWEIVQELIGTENDLALHQLGSEGNLGSERRAEENLIITKSGLRDGDELDEDILIYFNTNKKTYHPNQ